MEREKKAYTFSINVDSKGHFSYKRYSEPEETDDEGFSYRTGDTIQFKCNKGPFWVRYITMAFNGHDFEDGRSWYPVPDRISPFGRRGDRPVVILRSGSSPKDGSYETERREVGQNPDGTDMEWHEIQDSRADNGGRFVAFFRYLVHVEDNGKGYTDIEQNGMWWC